MIFVFTGNGKGKTTSAIGMGMRAAGAGKKVLMLQFLKTGSSENKTIKKTKNFDIKSFGREGFFLPQSKLGKKPELKEKGIKPLSEKDLKLFQKGFDLAKKAANSGKYQLLILDEIIIGLKFGLIKKKEIMDFLERYGEKLDIVLTGRYCSEEIIRIADLVTEMKEIKRPYQEKVKARKGIEY